MDLFVYLQLIFDQNSIALQWRKDNFFLTNSVEAVDIHMQKRILSIFYSIYKIYTKMNRRPKCKI